MMAVTQSSRSRIQTTKPTSLLTTVPRHALQTIAPVMMLTGKPTSPHPTWSIVQDHTENEK